LAAIRETMTTNDIERIENELSIQLPKHYKDFLLHYPKDLLELKLNKDFLSNDPEWIAEINKLIHKGKVPKEFIAIGIDLGGNIFYIKNEPNNTYVYWVDHEEVEEDLSVRNDLIWESVLEKKYKDLNDFKIWLIEFWGEILNRVC
jgi:hypothetical protein